MQEFRPEVALFRSELYKDSSCQRSSQFRVEFNKFRSEFTDSARNSEDSERNEGVKKSGLSTETFPSSIPSTFRSELLRIPSGMSLFRAEFVTRGRVFPF